MPPSLSDAVTQTAQRTFAASALTSALTAPMLLTSASLTIGTCANHTAWHTAQHGALHGAESSWLEPTRIQGHRIHAHSTARGTCNTCRASHWAEAERVAGRLRASGRVLSLLACTASVPTGTTATAVGVAPQPPPPRPWRPLLAPAPSLPGSAECRQGHATPSSSHPERHTCHAGCCNAGQACPPPRGPQGACARALCALCKPPSLSARRGRAPSARLLCPAHLQSCGGLHRNADVHVAVHADVVWCPRRVDACGEKGGDRGPCARVPVLCVGA